MKKVTIDNINIGEVLNGFKILDRVRMYDDTMNGYRCKCVKCGFVQEKSIGNLNKGRGCPVCSNKIVVRGINDLATTHPHILKFIVDKEYAYTHTYGSGDPVTARCPNCGREKEITLSNLIKYDSVGCRYCGDGVSYPNKFITSFLEQVGVCFKREKKFSWSNNKLYDFYIPEYNTIIEAHGKGHYCQYGFCSVGGRSLESEQENDKYKRQIALHNGIENYIEVDCRYSTKDFISGSLKSNEKIKEVFNIDFNNIDWDKCHNNSISNLIIEVCNFYNKNSTLSTSKIGEIFHLSKVTISTYLKNGNELGICEYNPKKNMSVNCSINNKQKRKKIIDLDTGKVYECAKHLSQSGDYDFKIDEDALRSSCRGHCNYTYKGHNFYYFDNLLEYDLEVVDVLEGDGRLKGTLGALVVAYKGNTVNVGSGYTDEDRAYLWAHKDELIGRVIAVKFKEETQDKKTGLYSLQFPIYVCTQPIGKEVSFN